VIWANWAASAPDAVVRLPTVIDVFVTPGAVEGMTWVPDPPVVVPVVPVPDDGGLLEQAAGAFLDYVENYTDGYRILLRGSGVGSASGTLTTLLGEVARQVEGILGREFRSRGYEAGLAPMYAQMLVGMVALTGQWWLDVRHPGRDDVVAQLVNLAWNGLSQLNPQPGSWSAG